MWVMTGPASEPAEDLARILAASAGGDDAAWRQLIGLYGRRVFAMAKSRCRNDDVAEEITQSVFATVAAKLTTGEYSERGRFEAWLFRVTMNRVRDELRRQRRRGSTAWSEDVAQRAAAPVERPAPDGGDLRALRGAMAQLPDADRSIVELRHHAGLSFKQIAEMLAEPMGTVLARHHRALRKLKALLESEGNDS